MKQHPDFLSDDDQRYAIECRRMAAMARPKERHVRRLVQPLRLWVEQAARYRQQQAGRAGAAKQQQQPAYT